MKNLILQIIALFVFLNFSTTTVGGGFGRASGAIGGAVSEQMSAHLIDAKDAAGGAKIGLTAATVTMLTGGDVKDMSTASATAASAHEYNRRLHPDELKW